jgi:hypothetical protein
VVDLVGRHTVYALHAAEAWLAALVPGAESAGGDAASAPSREELRARLEAVAAVLARTRSAPGLARVLERRRAWGDAEWQAYRAAKAVEAEGEALHRDGQRKEAGEKFREAVERLEGLGQVLDVG